MNWLARCIDWLPWIWPILGTGWYGGGVSLHDHQDANNGGALGDAAERNAWFGMEAIVAPTAFPAANVVSVINIPQTYAALILRVTQASSDTAARKVRVHVSTDNGASFDQTIGNYIGMVGAVAGGWGTPQQASLYDIGALTQAAAAGTNFSITITGYQAGAYLQAVAAGQTDTMLGTTLVMYVANVLAVNALQIAWDNTGNFDGGTYALYGVR